MEKKCLKCTGKLEEWDSNELQKRFTNGIQCYLCGVCADMVNQAMQKNREIYGINKKAYNKVIRRFKRENDIPLFSPLNAKQREMIATKNKALMRLMFIMDIRTVKNILNTDD